MKWEFTPIDLTTWNQTERRVMFVSAEPNGGNPNSGKLDMGEWFRTATPANLYHNNSRFYNRCKIILNGILCENDPENFNQFRFVDIKATQGGVKSSEKEIIDYVKSHLDEVLQFFISDNLNSGLKPHDIIILGNNTQTVFEQIVRPILIKNTSTIRYVYMPHPSAQTIANDLLEDASFEINKKLVPITLPANKWFCNGRKKYGWIKGE